MYTHADYKEINTLNRLFDPEYKWFINIKVCSTLPITTGKKMKYRFSLIKLIITLSRKVKKL